MTTEEGYKTENTIVCKSTPPMTIPQFQRQCETPEVKKGVVRVRGSDHSSPYNPWNFDQMLEKLRQFEGSVTRRDFEKSKFSFMFGTNLKREQCYDNIRISKASWDSLFCCVNPKFIACIVESGGGGAFLVLPHNKVEQTVCLWLRLRPSLLSDGPSCSRPSPGSRTQGTRAGHYLVSTQR